MCTTTNAKYFYADKYNEFIFVKQGDLDVTKVKKQME